VYPGQQVDVYLDASQAPRELTSSSPSVPEESAE
jgi:hypothetical protein